MSPQLTGRGALLALALFLPSVQAADDAVSGEIKSFCQRISAKLASVQSEECLERQLQASVGRSVNGTPILIKEYAPIPARKPLGRVLLVGGIHGDEYSSVSIVFKWMHTLDSHHSGLFHWRIVPLLNPDGLFSDESQRVNAHGVDLNRNFPMPEWESTTLGYWIQVTDRNPRRYPGSGPLSEPETRWFVDEINAFAPDVIVTVHAPEGVVDYDGPKDGPRRLGRLYLNLIGTYPGSLGNYAGIQHRIPVVTIELPYAATMPNAAEVADIWRDLVQWLTRNVPMRLPMAGRDAQDTEPS